MSKWAVWKTEEGELHVVPTDKSGDTVEDPHIVDRDCECQPTREYNPKFGNYYYVHHGEDEPVAVN